MHESVEVPASNHAFEEKHTEESGTEAESMAQGYNMVDSQARASDTGSKIPKVRRIEYYRQGL